MKKTITLLFFAIFIFSCKNEVKEEQNSLKGKIYTEINEIPELKNFEFQAESMIDYEGKKSNQYKFGISQFFKKGKYVLILEEKIRGKSKDISNKILDTIMISNLKEDEIISLCTCRVNGINNSEIIAVVKDKNNDAEYLNKIVKAWKANSKNGRIIPIDNLNGIDCVNESYGL
ncbi:hypothetical protein [Flavobacterium sp.]|uniref:hypothetical protein n=1 Tax=Flavobacterium sp. TaxID=239 RepID=UPI003D6B49A8